MMMRYLLLIKNSIQSIKSIQSVQSIKPIKSEQGFSLLEVMIVLTILASLTVMTSQSIQNAVKSKTKIDYLNEDMGRVRDALRIMQRDIELIMHYQDLETEIKDLIKEKRKALFNPNKNSANNGNTGAPTSNTTTTTTPNAVKFNPDDPNDPLNQKNPNRIDPTTHFIGGEDKIYFITMNNGRINESNPSADFNKVGYELEKCKKTGQEHDSLCIIRRSSALAEGDLTKGGEKIVLLENISEFKLRYLGKDKQDWMNDWNTLNGEASSKNKFPDAVEISIKTEKEENKKKKTISMQLMVPIRFVNNLEKKKSTSSNSLFGGSASETGADEQNPTPPNNFNN